MLQRKKLDFEFKQTTAEGTFEGLLSPFNKVDDGGDLVEPFAYAKNLQDRGNIRPLLWQHKADSPIGEVTLDARQDGLWAKGQLLMDLPDAQKAHLLIKHKIISGLSIGFKSVQDSVVNGIRHLKEINLFECSIVTFPMAPEALITSVKSGHDAAISAAILELTQIFRKASGTTNTRPR